MEKNYKLLNIYNANVLDFHYSKSLLRIPLKKGSCDLMSISECYLAMFDFLNSYKGELHKILASVRTDNFEIIFYVVKGVFKSKDLQEVFPVW